MASFPRWKLHPLHVLRGRPPAAFAARTLASLRADLVRLRAAANDASDFPKETAFYLNALDAAMARIDAELMRRRQAA